MIYFMKLNFKILLLYFIFSFNSLFTAELKEDFSWEKYKEIMIKESILDIESRNLRNATEKEKIKLNNEFEIKINNFKSLNISQDEINEKFNFAIKKNIQSDSYFSKKKSFTKEEKDVILVNAYFDIELHLSDKLMQIDNAKSLNELQREICTRGIDYDDCTERGIPKEINHNLEMAKKISKTVRCKDIYSQKCFTKYEARLVQLEKEEKERKIKAREAQKIFKNIYTSKKNKTILSCKEKENFFKNQSHSGFVDIIIYNDQDRIIIINPLDFKRSNKNNAILDSSRTGNSYEKVNLVIKNNDEYILEVEPKRRFKKSINTYLIFTKKNEFSYYRKNDGSFKKLFFTSSCINNSNKKFWDLAETPMYVDKKKIISKEKLKKGGKKIFDSINKINKAINKLPQ